MSSTFLDSLAAKQVLRLNLSKRTSLVSGNVDCSKMMIPLPPNWLQEVQNFNRRTHKLLIGATIVFAVNILVLSDPAKDCRLYTTAA